MTFRLVRIRVPDSQLAAARDVLDDQRVDYELVKTGAGDDETEWLVEFPLPSEAVERLLEDLRSADVAVDEYTVVTSVETLSTARADELEDRFVTGDEEGENVATEEIRTSALDLTPSPVTYYSMTLLSAVVAASGLLLDAPAVVVGSMVIAPLVGSAMTANVGVVLGDRDMILDGLRTQAFGLLLAVLGATAFGLAVRWTGILPPALNVATVDQVTKRISPGVLSLVIGACAGAAGAFGLATGVSMALVGVMIAAALVPAAAAVGIGLAWGIGPVVAGATLMLVLNAVAIHVSGVAVLWYFGYRPIEGDEDDGSLARTGVSVAVVVALLLVSVVAGVGVVSHVGFEQSVNGVVDDALGTDRYEELRLVSVRAPFDPWTAFGAGDDRQVVVTVSRPAERPYPDLGRTLSRRIEAETGQRTSVVVTFVDQQRYDPGEGGSGAGRLRPIPARTAGPTPLRPVRSR